MPNAFIRLRRHLYGKLRAVRARRGPRGDQRVVIYRPGTHVGTGHYITSAVVYGALAESLGARFHTTVEGTIFAANGNEALFYDRFLRLRPGADSWATTGWDSLRGVMEGYDRLPRRRVIVGRAVHPERPMQSFPALKGTRNMDRGHEPAHITRDYLDAYDLIYVDSVFAPDWLLAELAPIDPVLQLHPRIIEAARDVTGAAPYLAVHLRHGNGEFMHGRVQGDHDTFDTYLAHIARVARDTATAQGLTTIYCLSDNAEAAERLAEACGGRTLGAENLPDRPHLDFHRADPGSYADNMERMFLDLAILAGADQIVAGESAFGYAAAVWGDPTRLQIVSPDGHSQRFLSDA